MFKSAWLLSGFATLGVLAGTASAQEAKPMPAPAPTPVVSTSPVMIGGCDSGCCTSAPCCNMGCDSCCRQGGHLLADIGFMILTPKFSENPAFYGMNFSGPTEQLHEQDFSYGSQFVPQISVGYIGSSGFGARINWFGFALGATQVASPPSGTRSFAQAASPLNIQELDDSSVFAGPGQTLVTGTKLEMNVWDFEAVGTINTGCWSLLGSAGVRYAHIAQAYIAFNTLNDTDSANLISGHNFNGAGPTVGFEARRQLGDSGLFLYGKARGSVLFGTSIQAAAIFFSGATAADVVADSRTDSVIPEGELELGVGFRRETRLGDLFLQAGVVGQIWGNVGSGAMSNGSSNFFFNDEEASISRDSALGLIGFTVRTGLTY